LGGNSLTIACRFDKDAMEFIAAAENTKGGPLEARLRKSK
jgi:hypothetical protein